MFLTNAINNLRRNLSSQNALAKLADVNIIGAGLTANYKINTHSGKLSGNPEDSQPIPNVGGEFKVYRASINQLVTNALTAGKRLNVADTGVQGYLFSIGDIYITLGADVAWDGGDMEIYLGDNKIATILAADLITGAGAAKEFQVKTSAPVVTGSGTYSAATGFAIVDATLINIRLTAETTSFAGFIGITIPTGGLIQEKSADCGSWCDSCSGTTKYVECSGSKCVWCPSAVAFNNTDVI